MLPYMLPYPSSFPLAVLVLGESFINRVLNPLEFVLCALRGFNTCIRRVLHEIVEGSEFDIGYVVQGCEID
jgi:hypothetical protein